MDGKISVVSLAESGLGGNPDSFYLLFLYVSRVATLPEVEAMLLDRSAAVRVVGAMVVLKTWRGMPIRSVDKLLNDKEEIMACDSSCMPSHITVGAVVAGLKGNRDFMDVQKVDSDQSAGPASTSRGGSP